MTSVPRLAPRAGRGRPAWQRTVRLAAAAAGLAGSVMATVASAENKVDCSTPSGIGTHACTFPEGQVVVETSLVDATLDNAGGLRTTSVLLADTLVRVGVTRRFEAQIGWTPFDHERTVDRYTGDVASSSGVGDVSVGGKFALISTEDHAIGIAIQPSLIIPVGGQTLGSGGIGGGLLVPVTYDLSDAVAVEFTPEATVTGDRDDDRRHLEYGATIGVAWSITSTVFATAEYRALRDEDPAYHRTKQVGAISAAWQLSPRLQVNAGVAIGLTSESPRREILIGFARHFR